MPTSPFSQIKIYYLPPSCLLTNFSRILHTHRTNKPKNLSIWDSHFTCFYLWSQALPFRDFIMMLTSSGRIAKSQMDFQSKCLTKCHPLNKMTKNRKSTHICIKRIIFFFQMAILYHGKWILTSQHKNNSNKKLIKNTHLKSLTKWKKYYQINLSRLTKIKLWESHRKIILIKNSLRTLFKK